MFCTYSLNDHYTYYVYIYIHTRTHIQAAGKIWNVHGMVLIIRNILHIVLLVIWLGLTRQWPTWLGVDLAWEPSDNQRVCWWKPPWILYKRANPPFIPDVPFKCPFILVFELAVLERVIWRPKNQPAALAVPSSVTKRWLAGKIPHLVQWFSHSNLARFI